MHRVKEAGVDKSPQDINPCLQEGMNHENKPVVYDGMDAILRQTTLMHADLDIRAIPESQSLSFAYKHGIPCQRIYEARDEDSALVLEFIKGSTLNNLFGSMGVLPDWVVVRMCDVMKRLHGLDTKDFGPSARLNVPEGNSEAFFIRIAEMYRRIIDSNKLKYHSLFASVGIPDDAITGVIERVCVTAKRRFALCHCDLHRKNIVVRDNDGDLALLDWELALVGDPCYDLAIHLQKMRYEPQQEDLFLCLYLHSMKCEERDIWLRDIKAYRMLETFKYACIDLMRLAEMVQTSELRVGDEPFMRYAKKIANAFNVWGQPSPLSASEIEALVRSQAYNVSKEH